MGIHENKSRAELKGTASWHAALHTERLCLIRSREHNAAANSNRLSAQGRIEQLFD
jgi:hypothetical protein